jgi:hypothetical protein
MTQIKAFSDRFWPVADLVDLDLTRSNRCIPALRPWRSPKGWKRTIAAGMLMPYPNHTRQSRMANSPSIAVVSSCDGFRTAAGYLAAMIFSNRADVACL